LGSSDIVFSPQRLVSWLRHLWCFGLVTLIESSTSSLTAQAPGPGALGSPDLPRFTVREIIAGHNDTLARIPGRWLKAARTLVPDSLAFQAYQDAASRGGLAPLPSDILDTERSRHALRATLDAVRSTIPSPRTRARFDHLFRSNGEWVVDLHDAALAWARSRAPGIGWSSARRSLAATGWIPPDDSAGDGEAVPRSLYALGVLAGSDSARFQSIRSDLWMADSTSAAAAHLLLTGYTEARRWHSGVVEFLLTQPWIPDGDDGHSLSDQVQRYWERESDSTKAAIRAPEIRTRLFGYPQAVPHYGVPRALFERLVRADNMAARAWLGEHGAPELLRTLRALPAGDSLLLLQHGTETIRLTSVRRLSRESLNGFLEPRDAIAIDPGYSPLLAVGAVVHEWQHLLFRRKQLEAFAARLPAGRDSIIELPWLEPYLAEGFAEWSTEQILAPVVQRWPLLAMGELQKRAALTQAAGGDEHTMGYALVRALAEALGNREATTTLLLEHAARPSRLMTSPALRRAWRRFAPAADSVVTVPAQRVLIPEVTFTVEDGFPDVITSRILLPPLPRRVH
jgi:hypothetical protein